MILARILKSPLLHFFALGGLIFGVYSMLNNGPAPQSPDKITLSTGQAQALRDRFAATWNRPPSRQELDALLHRWAEEEAMVREARKLGLDRDDSAIRQRLALKMEYLGESGAASIVPDDATLDAYMKANRAQFERPEAYAFDQVALAQSESPAEIETLRVALRQGADPTTKGRGGMLPASVPLTAVPVIDRSFGAGFHEALANLPEGVWHGPVQSAYGMHLVRVTGHRDATLPALAEVRKRVEAEWRGAKAREMTKAFTEALMQRYDVTLPSADEVLAQ